MSVNVKGALDFDAFTAAVAEDCELRVASAGLTRVLICHDDDQAEAGSGFGMTDRPSSRRQAAAASRSEQSELIRSVRERGLHVDVLPLEQVSANVEFRDSNHGDVAVGFAFQRGWIPATAEALEKAALVGVVGGDSPSVQKVRPGLVFGRLLAHADESATATATTGPRMTSRPARFTAASAPPAESPRLSLRLPEQTIRRHAFVMSRRIRLHAHRRAEAFETLAHAALDAMTGLRRGDPARETERILVDRLVDCETWGGLAACRAYNDLVQRVYEAESAVGEFDVTRMIIPELGRAMILTDAPFVCATFARPDVRRWLRRLGRFGIDPQDDFTFRLRGRIHSRIPRTLIGPYWKFTPVTARLVRHLHWVRLMPFVNRERRQYRAWVMGLVERCAAELPERRSVWIEVFRQFARVHGPWPKRYRRIRGVRMAVQSLLDIADSSDRDSIDETSEPASLEP